MHTSSSQGTGRFRPVSIADFQAYAKSLAWLCEFPLQRAQEVLARMYGYAGLHELQQTMKRPGEPGPFMHSWSDDALLKSSVHGDKYFADVAIANVYSRRMFNVVAEEKGQRIEDFPLRFLRLSDLLLFDPPAQQREGYRQLRGILDAIDGNDAPSGDRLPTEYADLETDGRTSYLAFTPLGQTVFDAAMELVPDSSGRLAYGRPGDEAIDKLQALIDRHPYNPWPRAILLCGYASYYYQDGWANNLHDHAGGFTLDAERKVEEYQRNNALSLLNDAEIAIAAFEELYGSHKGEAPDHRTFIRGADTFYWPAVLYFGGLIALNAGKPKLAKKWLTLNRKICPDDNFGARFYLGAIALNDGKPKLRSIFKNSDPWSDILMAAEAARDGQYGEAAKRYGEAVERTWAAIEAFAGKWKDARACRVMSNIYTPAYLQELMFRTAPFWSEHPRVRLFFELMAKNKELRGAALELHRHRSDNIGSAFREGANPFAIDQMRERLEAALASAAIQAGVKAASALDA